MGQRAAALASGDESPRSAGGHFVAWLIVSVGIGAVLRLHQINGQILLDDEWHAIRTLVWRGYGYILTHFGTYDHCIPLTVFDRLLMDTIGLSEMGMRLPVLMSGLAALVVFPLLVRRLAGSATALVFSLLLAVSPVHVYFSRYARPYAITLLLSFTAVVGFFLWWRDGRRSWAMTYCLAGAAAVYFHLAALPMVLAPLPWAVLDALRAGKAAAAVRSMGRLALCAGGLAGVLAVFLGPPWLVDSRAIMKKVGRAGEIDLESIRGAAEILFGTGSRPVLFSVVALSVIGLAVLWRRFPGLSGFLVFPILAQAISYRMTAPLMGQEPFVIARYHLWILPVLLLCLSQGIVAAEAALRSRWAAWPPGGLGWLGAITLVAAGPLPGVWRTPNAWTNHGVYQYAYSPNSHVRFDNFEPVRLSSFYDGLRGREPGTVVVLEAPWSFKWYQNPYPNFQKFHRQRMKVGFVAGEGAKSLGHGELLPGQAGFDLRNAIHVSDVGKVRALGVDYVIFHRDLGGEMRLRPGEPFPDVTPWIARYQEMIGAPVHQDAAVVVFKVK